MAEPFTVLSIAANIAQFLGYGLQLLSDGKEMYNSLHGALDEYHELEAIIEDIRNISNETKHLSGHSIGENTIRKLAAECMPLAEKLLGILNDLKVPNDARFRGLKTLHQTFRSAGKKKEIQILKHRLMDLDMRLRTRTSWMLQRQVIVNCHSDVMSAIDSLAHVDDGLKLNLTSNLNQLRIDILEKLQVPATSNARGKDFGLDSLSKELLSFLDEGKRVKHQQDVLQSLVFEEMKQREETIKDAHEMTLNWMFEKPETGFMNWLKADSGIYWVRGKVFHPYIMSQRSQVTEATQAGSGKSTLMKYICAHDTTLNALESWATRAGSRTLVTASCFFWNAGLPMQKSIRGLLQSLLFQVFRAYPSLILETSSKDPKVLWTQKELTSALAIASKSSKLPSKFCFFVDGLDEYDGDHEDIVQLLQSLAASPNIKICVSSRPWNAFIDVFEQCSSKLVLEDFTNNDMQKYVHNMLAQDKIFMKAAKGDSRCQTLVPQIADKAQGVWLWVYLVVRDLLRDLKGREGFPLLQRRLDSFPAELEKYFASIIERIDKIHREETAKIFRITVDAVTPIPALGLQYLLVEQEDPEYALKMQIQPIFREQEWENAQKWERLLNSRCSDLLELNFRSTNYAPPIMHHKVEFLHRTVIDFLRDNYQNELREWAGHFFDTSSSLSNIILGLIKGYPVPQGTKDLELKRKFENDVSALTAELICYARKLERNGKSNIKLLNEFDRVLCYRSGKIGDPCSHERHWNSMRHKFNDLGGLEEFSHRTILALAIHAGLRLYVDKMLNEYPELLNDNKEYTLLEHALAPFVAPSNKMEQIRKFTDDKMREYALVPPVGFHSPSRNQKDQIYTLIDTEMLEILLSHGADPNKNRRPDQKGDQNTVWMDFLNERARENRSKYIPEDIKSNWYEACQLLIDYGADLDTNISIAQSGALHNSLRVSMASKASINSNLLEVSIISIIHEIFGHDKAERLIAKINEEAKEVPSKTTRLSIIWRLLAST
ncbi:uncharacterized protein K444DRAFT_626616 [Hyaloscypha bicolor E]|uniref:NACHT domain-containing protein n=1 Tax=Hyaloscypha bicolor E TaxID=1095630 RepID=A0A2J6TKI4_9HELO|nr:uncharacterized protein K444DRAFT_626616 [Hyaloscypha bicolor E]PMD63535.1 hypothetical protein K444DRAFT_626616 [Hyaloscypha bicolor E]